MNNLPRFLPLVFVAVGGVIAMKTVSSLEGAPEVLRQATAWAEGAKSEKAATAKPKPVTAKKAVAKAAGEGGADASMDTTTASDHLFAYSDSNSSQSLAPSAAAASKPAAATVAPAPICPTSVADLAKQAGISPSELTILQSLSARRQQLDARESALNSQSQLLEAASTKLDTRIKQLQEIKGQIQALLDQANKTSDEDSQRMVKVYESMKPKDAANVLATMSDDVRLPIAARMKEAKLAAVLGAMSPGDAKDLTEKLSQRMKRTNDVNARLNQVAGQAGVAPPAKPAQPANKTATPPASAAKTPPKA